MMSTLILIIKNITSIAKNPIDKLTNSKTYLTTQKEGKKVETKEEKRKKWI